jgi:cystathionine beta-lyase
MKYNFDEVIDRSNTSCEKYDKRIELFGTEDVIPLWVADMDFKVAQPIVDALRKRVEQQIFGYTFQNEAYYESIINWEKRRNNWEIKREWIMHSPGVVPGLAIAVQSLTKEGDKIVIMPPVYRPFFNCVTDNNRVLLENNLKHNGLEYSIDYEDLENKLKEAKMLILCSPQNPIGKVWKREDLEKIAQLCLKYKVIIVSDEIHSDMIFKPHKHIPIASLSPEIGNICLTFFAPSKTFNIAGFATSVAVASNQEIHDKFWSGIMKIHLNEGNIAGTTALTVAYNEGEEWLEQMLDYVWGNANFAVDFIAKNMPKLKTKLPEASYLIWIDFSELGLSQAELMDFLVKEAKVGLNNGTAFSDNEGIGFMRFNLATSRTVVEKALNNMLKAYNKLVVKS